MKKWIKIGLITSGVAIIIFGIAIGIFFSFSGKDMFGKDHAKVFLLAAFSSNASVIMAEPAFSVQEKTSALLNYSQAIQKKFGQYLDSSFSSLNRTGNKSILEGTLHFSNGDAPVCIVEVKSNDTWAVYGIQDTCNTLSQS